VIEFQPADAVLGGAVRRTTDKLAGGRLTALAELTDPQAARTRAREARRRAVAALDESLALFEAAAARAGTVVHRAADAADAVRIVEGVLARAGARRVVKSKSMATEEIRLREHLERRGREVVETDLGEWIVQLAGQAPSHIIVPAVHLTRQRIRVLLSHVAGRDLGPDTAALAGFARAHLRTKFLEAEAGISGANLLVAETGTLMIVSNEGNARMCTTLPRLHIAVVGVEKVVRTWEDALAVLRVLPRAATGQAITQYVSFLTGPRRPGDPPGDGPDEVHVVLLDNGRRRLVGTPAEELLYCIRCGACLNVCPVYRTMGGHAYGSVYPGPIGAALTPRLTAGRVGRDLPWASSLCGACREACPVGIALDDQLIALRAEYPKALSERAAMRAFVAVAGRPAAFRRALRVARVLLGGQPAERLPGVLDGWTRTRSLRAIAPARRRPLRRGGPSGMPPGGTAASPPAPATAPADIPDGGPAPTADPTAVVQRFLARWEAQGGRTAVVRREGLAAAVRELLAVGPVSVDPALSALVADLPQAPAPEAAVGLVRAEAAAAETGSVVLRSGPHTERRRSLLPPRVVFVVEEADVHPDLEAAFRTLGLLANAGQVPAAVTVVSGPSRSADIENDLVIGVHGPGEAFAVLVQDSGRPRTGGPGTPP
jgi:L-lactate dehydrogenase complex protein LldF